MEGAGISLNSHGIFVGNASDLNTARSTGNVTRFTAAENHLPALQTRSTRLLQLLGLA